MVLWARAAWSAKTGRCAPRLPHARDENKQGPNRLTRSLVPASVFAATEGAIAILAFVLLLWRRRSLSRGGGGRGRGFGGGGHLAKQLSAHRCRRSKYLRSPLATRKPTAQRLRWIEEMVVVCMPCEQELRCAELGVACVLRSRAISRWVHVSIVD